DVATAAHGVTVRAENREQIPSIVSVLVRSGVPIYRLAEREPDLEAAYFALHGRAVDGRAVERGAVEPSAPVEPSAVK
ncbi:MAG TPA: hypothetical protein VG106_08025, partial [Vicinamibacterales bacterium]|nr:hypothetical protein [Vicinamibacterales bacterium]